MRSGKPSMRALSGVTMPTRLLPPISISTDRSKAAIEEKAVVKRQIGVCLGLLSHIAGLYATPFRAEHVR